MKSVIFLVAIISFEKRAGGASWSYDDNNGDGPSYWEDTYADCGGNSQSPIDISTTDIKTKNHKDFHFSNYGDTSDITVDITNNGHSAQLSLSGATLMLSGGDLPEDYIFAQLHFHWGSNDNRGSEHTVDGDEFPLEMHLVHYADIYYNITEAIDQDEGLAVLGFLFEIDSADNDDINEIIEALEGITDTDDETNVDVFPIKSLFNAALGSYYRYAGSLTTPGCYESVVWTVFEDTIKISSRQLATFRDLLDDNSDNIEDNYRPVQALNGRTVYYYHDDHDGVASTVASFAMIVWCFVLSKLFPFY